MFGGKKRREPATEVAIIEECAPDEHVAKLEEKINRMLFRLSAEEAVIRLSVREGYGEVTIEQRKAT